MTTKHDLN